MAKILIKKTLDPTSISDIGLWLKADSGVILNDSNVSIWQDQSKNSNNAVAKTGGVTVVENSLNGKPVLRFDGSSNLITNSFYVTNYNTPITIIVVSRASASNVFNSQTARYVQAVNDQYDWDFGLTYGNYGTQNPNFSVCHGKSYAGSNDIESSPMGENAIGLSIGINDGSTISSYLNGTLIGTANSSTWNNGGDAVGSFSIGSEVVQNINEDAFFAKCDIAEILIYKKALNSTERQAIENYLNIKYSLGLSIPNTPFPASSGNSKLNIKKVIEGSQVSSLSGLSLWLKADAGVSIGGGNHVNTWADQSSNGNNAVGPTMKKPVYVANGINGKPTMTFNGSTELFTINDSNSLDITSGSVYIVMQRVGNGAGNDVIFLKNANSSSGSSVYAIVLFNGNPWIVGLDKGNGYGDNSTNFNVADNNPHIIGYRFDTNSLLAHQDNLVSSNLGGGSIPSTIGTLQIGGYNASFNTEEYFNGKISEVIIFNRYLSDSEHASIVGYLNNKYSIYPASYLQNGKLRIKTPPPFPTNGLLAFWRLNNPDGLSTISSDFGSYALNSYGYTSVPGKINNAFNFSSNSKGMWTNEQIWNLLTNPTSFSVSYWIKISDNSSTYTLMGSTFGSMGFHFDHIDDSYFGGTNYGIAMSMSTINGPYQFQRTFAREFASTDTWYHVVGTYNYPSTTMKLYINGDLKDTNTNAIIGPNSAPSWHGFALNGSVYNGGKEYGDSQSFDAVGFWNRDLTLSEIASLYNGGNGSEI